MKKDKIAKYIHSLAMKYLKGDINCLLVLYSKAEVPNRLKNHMNYLVRY